MSTGWMLLLAVLLVALVLTVLLAAAGAWRWRRASLGLQARLAALRLPQPVPPRVHLAELESLPAPVQRYLRLVLREGEPVVTAVQLRQEGTFNLKADGDGWKPFSATQHVLVHRPGFVWDARITLAPGLDVHVHDAYLGGRGVLHAAVLGAVPLARLDGSGELAQAELMRWLAETPWYPTALLPSQGVQWQAVDGRNADATVVDGEMSATLRFHFDSDGLVDTVTASARARMVGASVKAAAWQGRFWNYALRDGLRVPLQGEAAWLLPGGASPYWRGRVTGVAFEGRALAAAPAAPTPGTSAGSASRSRRVTP